MEETGFINTIREIWWDVRPHHSFGTVEVRVCDMPGHLDDVLSLTALVQCLVKTLSDQIEEGTYQHDCHPVMVSQNKWRACRFGNQARLVNSYTYDVQTVSQVVESLIEKLRPVSQELGCWDDLQRVQLMADSPDWAQRQRAIFAQTGDRREIVRQLTELSRISEKVPK
jgi:carboxylate-amine ligase